MTPGTSPWHDARRQGVAARRDDVRRRDDQRLLTSLLVGAAVAGGVFVLATSPRLRRLAWRGAGFALTTWLPAWGLSHVRAAWAETAPAPSIPALGPPRDADRA
jgi:hypothetical protein